MVRLKSYNFGTRFGANIGQVFDPYWSALDLWFTHFQPILAPILMSSNEISRFTPTPQVGLDLVTDRVSRTPAPALASWLLHRLRVILIITVSCNFCTNYWL